MPQGRPQPTALSITNQRFPSTRVRGPMVSVFREARVMSYLADVKLKLFTLVEELRGELGTVEASEETPEVFDQWKKNALWPAVEEALKESYKNGVRDGAQPQPSDKPQERKAASWRKPKAKEGS